MAQALVARGLGGLLVLGGLQPRSQAASGSAAARGRRTFAGSGSARLGDHVYEVTSYVLDRTAHNASGSLPTPPPLAVAQEVHVADAGLVFRASIRDQSTSPVDLSGVSRIDFLFQRPDGSLLTGQALFTTDGTDGLAEYVTGQGDLDQVGVWRHQVRITNGPSVAYSQIVKFRVYPNLPLGA
jgi:hypothetical protein